MHAVFKVEANHGGQENMKDRHLRTRAHSLLHRWGFDIVPYSGRYFPSKRRIETMRDTDVSVLIDVGANQGQYVTDVRRDGWRGTALSIEPLPDAYAVLADRASRDDLWASVNVALGAESGVSTLNVARNQVSSSLLEMTERHRTAVQGSAFVESIEVRVETLDALVADRGLAGSFYLKIDTQGYELEVLRGAIATIDACRAIELELSLEPLYEGQPLMPEICRWLLDHEFIAVALWPSLCDPHGRKLMQMDGIFVPAQGKQRT